MSFRDPLQAALARIAALEAEVAQLRRARPDERPPAPPPPDRRLDEALQGRRQAELAAAEARTELASLRATFEVDRLELEHRLRLLSAEHDAEQSLQAATATAELRRVQAEQTLRLEEAEARRDLLAAHVSGLEAEIEVLLELSLDGARSHYARRLAELQQAQADDERARQRADRAFAALEGGPLTASDSPQSVEAAKAMATRDVERAIVRAQLATLSESVERRRAELRRAKGILARLADR